MVRPCSGCSQAAIAAQCVCWQRVYMSPAPQRCPEYKRGLFPQRCFYDSCGFMVCSGCTVEGAGGAQSDAGAGAVTQVGFKLTNT